MILRAKAPLRISFAGGGTDIAPYPQEHGGVVLSTAINKYAYATLTTREDHYVQIRSLDYGITVKHHMHQLLYDGNLDLAKASILGMAPLSQGIDLTLHCDVAPGSGLGSSSALVVATLGLLNHLQGRQLSTYALARLAHQVERVELAMKGGLQDQYAAAFGGFNFMEFLGDEVVVTPLRLSAATLNELHYHLLLCYTGKTHLSSTLAARQQEAYERKESEVLSALDELKMITIEMKNALLRNRLDQFGELLHAGWENKKRLAQGISSPEIDLLYELARQQGALGGKILGAGGGGYLLVYASAGRKQVIAESLERAGASCVDFSFDRHGLQTWKVLSKEE